MKAANQFAMLCDNAFDFLARSAREIESEPKHALVSFAAGMELLLKARLLDEHWTLTVQGKPNRESFLAGDFSSVSMKDALERLEAVLGEPVPKEAAAAFSRVASHRNRALHFFHDLGDRAAVAKDMCIGWLYLSKQLKQWGPAFSGFDRQVRKIDLEMRKVTAFLSAAFEDATPELDRKRSKGIEVKACSGCGYVAATVELEQPPVWKETCLVCAWSVTRISFPCPGCEAPRHFTSWDCFQPIQCECGVTIDQDDVRQALDESDPFDETAINCGECESPGTVILHGDLYICVECASYGPHTSLATCEWCQECQLNGSSLELSSISGCAVCDGRGVDDD